MRAIQSLRWLTIALPVFGGSEFAAAQNNTTAPMSSQNEEGAAGDPNGAIRALEGSSEGNTKAAKTPVTVPKLGDEGPRTGGTPRGTSSDGH